MKKQSKNQSNTKKTTKIIFNPKSNVIYQNIVTDTNNKPLGKIIIENNKKNKNFLEVNFNANNHN